MKRLASLVMTGALLLAGTPAAQAANFELAPMQGTNTFTSGMFRIETKTGKVWLMWCCGAQYQATVDPGPLPGGDYHLYLTQNVAADGKVIWTITRFDMNTGRTWQGNYPGGDAPLTWQEIAPPK